MKVTIPDGGIQLVGSYENFIYIRHTLIAQDIVDTAVGCAIRIKSVCPLSPYTRF